MYCVVLKINNKQKHSDLISIYQIYILYKSYINLCVYINIYAYNVYTNTCIYTYVYINPQK